METNVSQYHVLVVSAILWWKRSLGDEKGPGRKGSTFSVRNVS